MRVTITIPDYTFDALTKLAGEQELSRSRLCRNIVESHLMTNCKGYITEVLNHVYADGGPPLDPVLEACQRETMLRVEWEEPAIKRRARRLPRSARTERQRGS